MSRLAELRKLAERGDTIVEVLVCLAIIGSTLTISYGLARRSLQQVRDAQERQEMTTISQGELERLHRFIDKNNSKRTDFIDSATGLGLIFCIDENLKLRVMTPPLDAHDTTCAVNSAGDYLSIMDGNYGKKTQPFTGIVDQTYPYRSTIVFVPTVLPSSGNPSDDKLSDFYVISGRYGVAGHGADGPLVTGGSINIVPLMYRQPLP